MTISTAMTRGFAKLSVLALTLAAVPALATQYKIDPAHSRIGFSVKHLMISNVQGQFKDFEGNFNFDEKAGTVTDANFTAKADSIDTGVTKRDEHLKSPDFFDTAKFPTLTLTNSKIKKAGKNKYKWTADLTMHGVTKPVTLDLEHIGTVKDPMAGVMRAGFKARGKINRKDFGLNWNKAMEAGGVVVGDEVMIELDAEGVEAAPTEPTKPAAEATPAGKPMEKK